MFIIRKILLYMQFYTARSSRIYASSLGGRKSIEHVIKPARLLAKMHDKRTI